MRNPSVKQAVDAAARAEKFDGSELPKNGQIGRSRVRSNNIRPKQHGDSADYPQKNYQSLEVTVGVRTFKLQSEA